MIKDMTAPGDGVDEIQPGLKFLDFLSDAIFIYSDGKILFANNKALKLMNIQSLESIINKPSSEVLRCHFHYRCYIEDKLGLAAAGEHIAPFEQSIIRPDGMAMNVEMTVTSYFLPGHNAAMIIIKDVTERKRMENLLKNSEERYERLVALSPDAIFITDVQHILFANQAAAELLGAPSPQTLIGRKFLDFAHPEDTRKVVNRVTMSLEKQKYTKRGDRRLIRLDGKVIHVEVANTDLIYEGKKAVMSIVRDMAERRKAQENERLLEETLEHDRLKTEFFSNLSHELKTPLNIILSVVQLITHVEGKSSEYIPFDKLNKHVSTIRQNCYRLLRLINNLIDVTRLDAGYLKMNYINHNIVSIIEDVTLSVAQYIESKGIGLVFDTDVEEKVTAFDPDKIERVMLNLLSNAVKFTGEGGGIWVNIDTREDRVRISVKDTGCGIPEDMLGKIFDRFSQVSPLFTRNHEGSGIGLSLVKSIVEAHGGEVAVESVYGRGSVFSVVLPVRVEDGAPEGMTGNERNLGDRVDRISVEFSDIYG